MSVLPLAGLKVLDLASLYAAPLAATILADFGAEVVKIEPLAGDGFRGTRMWPIVGRNKKSVALDLREPEGCEILRKMIPEVDVIVENYPPSVLAKRKIGWPELSALNPRMVMLSLSCFGQTGPYTERPGSGTIGEGFGGLTHLTGAGDGAPVLPSVALGDAIGAMNAVIGVMTALYWRDHGGTGQKIDATLYEPVLHAVAQAMQFWRPGDSPSRNGSRMPAGDGIRNVYNCRDGGYVVISASTARHTSDLLALAGAPQDCADTDRAIAAFVRRHDLKALVELLVHARIRISPINTLDSLIADSHIQARGSLYECEDPELGPIVIAAPSPRLMATPGSIRTIGSKLGADTASVIGAWAKIDGAALKELRSKAIVG